MNFPKGLALTNFPLLIPKSANFKIPFMDLSKLADNGIINFLIPYFPLDITTLWHITLSIQSIRVLLLMLYSYIDDIVLFVNDLSEINFAKTFLRNCFKIKDLGTLRLFIGI